MIRIALQPIVQLSRILAWDDFFSRELHYSDMRQEDGPKLLEQPEPRETHRARSKKTDSYKATEINQPSISKKALIADLDENQGKTGSGRNLQLMHENCRN
jgi:hypothetical protein